MKTTTTTTRRAAVSRAQLAGEWLGEAALSMSNWLAALAAQRQATHEATLRTPALAVDARGATAQRK